MNEQQLADLFSEQIDHLLAGQATVDSQGLEELSELFNLGQELSHISFQASPAAQTAFQAQLTSWFGPAGGGLSATVLGTPKIWLAGIIAAITVLGAGLGLLGLLNSNTPQTQPQERINAPATVEFPATNTSVPIEDGDTDTPLPKASSTIKDTLPTAPSHSVLGDTLPTPTPSPEPTGEETDEPTQPFPSGTPSIAGDDDVGDRDSNPPTGDQDRGHGNDPDGYDEDNPGNSSGVSGGGDNNQDNNGAPGNIERGQENDNGGGSSGGGGGNGQGQGGSKK